METYHLVAEGKLWKLRKEGANGAPIMFNSKELAIEQSVALMRDRGGSLRIQKHDGTFEERTFQRSANRHRSRG